MPDSTAPTLVTGAAGQVGGVGRRVVEALRASDLPVRALVRVDDDRAAQLRKFGAEVVVADLTKLEEVVAALQGCKRVFFSMSVSPQYVEATAVIAAAARAASPPIELLLNMSQMTVSDMDLTHVSESPQHRLHWLGEQVLNWSGVPVAHLRPTVFQQNPIFGPLAAKSIEDSGTLRMPFGKARTSPIAAQDVAEVAAKILLRPTDYVGKVIELTGPRPVDMDDLAKEYSAALGRSVQYVDVPLETWRDEVLKQLGLPEHVYHHILVMAKLHAAGGYDRYTSSVQDILGRPAASISSACRR